MQIEQINNNKRGIFQAKENGIVIGELTYSWINPEKISIGHTGVLPEFEGKGIATQLVMEAVKFAREKK